jgi:hypothetical protein
MGIRLVVQTIKPADENWLLMKDIYDSCKKANVPVPKEVEKFFDYVPPTEAGVIGNLPSPCREEWTDDCREGMDIDLSQLPHGTKKLRVYISY